MYGCLMLPSCPARCRLSSACSVLTFPSAQAFEPFPWKHFTGPLFFTLVPRALSSFHFLSSNLFRPAPPLSCLKVVVNKLYTDLGKCLTFVHVDRTVEQCSTALDECVNTC